MNDQNNQNNKPDGAKQEMLAGVIARMSSIEQAILQQRARDLAKAATDNSVQVEMIEVLVFVLGRERYAVDVRYVQEVRVLETYTPVPCTPPFVVGAANLQGEILSLVNLCKFLNIPQEGISDLMNVIIMDAAGLRVGCLADQIHEVTRIPLNDFAAPPATLDQIGHTFVRGVTTAGLILLDMNAVFSDPRFVIDEEIV